MTVPFFTFWRDSVSACRILVIFFAYKKIALSKVPGGEAVKVEIDKDHGLPVYKAQLVSGEFEYEIKIHAKTGRVLNIKKDFRH